MYPIIDNEELFKEILQTGINLFTGSGFSVLPYNGHSLPTGKTLCKEVCSVFNIHDIYEDDLETISSLAPKQAYQKFLRDRFKVDGCNKLYFYINNIKLNSFITTNIDNIPYHIYSNSSSYFLKSSAYYGASKSSTSKIDFIPLHGDVTDINTPLYFGKFDLSLVDEVNKDLFDIMHAKLLESATLFWGYAFHDSGVLKSISRVLGKKSQDFWIQCRPEDKKMITLFKEKGCNIIISETDKLLQWIGNNISHVQKSTHAIHHDLKKYLIPSILAPSIEALPASEYYQKGSTHWYPILTKQAYETSMVNTVYNNALKGKNVIIVGCDFTGKSTLLMQIALKVNSENKLFIKDSISKEEATFILSKLNNSDAWIFCAKNSLYTESFLVLAKAKNIRLVSIFDEYSFETSKHLLSGVEYIKLEMGEIIRREAELIFEHIPSALRKKSFSYKEIDSEKYSMLELILKNVHGVLTRERIAKILLSIKNKDENAIKTIALASYLTQNNSALSTDIIFSFFKLKDYDEVKRIINSVNSVLNRYYVGICPDEADQDYYGLRSKFFAHYAVESFLQNIQLKQIYAEVIKEFIYNVSKVKIYNYQFFKRTAYDGNIFADLFDEEGMNIYNFLYDKYNNPYILQQMALFLGKLNKYEEAFSYINKARGELPNNFSVKNSEAILLFEANKRKKTDLALSKMDEAMSILEDCYTNDKRKVYHAQKYADFALILHKEFKVSKYIEKSISWIKEIMDKKDSLSRKTHTLMHDLSFIVRK